MESARTQIRGYRNADWKGFNNYDTALAYASDKQAQPQADIVAKKAALNGHGNATANGVGELQKLKAQLDELAQELADAETAVTDKLVA